MGAGYSSRYSPERSVACHGDITVHRACQLASLFGRCDWKPLRGSEERGSYLAKSAHCQRVEGGAHVRVMAQRQCLWVCIVAPVVCMEALCFPFGFIRLVSRTGSSSGRLASCVASNNGESDEITRRRGSLNARSNGAEETHPHQHPQVDCLVKRVGRHEPNTEVTRGNVRNSGPCLSLVAFHLGFPCSQEAY